MILGDLLSELRENVLRDRSDQIAGVTDQLWSDATLVRYINAAQDRFAKRAECLRDGTTKDVTQIQLVVGQEFYPMHPKVIGVLSARFTGIDGTVDGADLARAGHANLDTYTAVDNRYFDFANITTLQPGKIVAFTTDESMLSDGRGSLNTMVFRSFPPVGVGYNGVINMRVVRLPLAWMSPTNLDAQPEIPEQYHLNILDWAAYLALRGPDLDIAGGDAPARAKEFASSFEAHVLDAKRELKRRMFTPAAYKFGGNGFSYPSDWNP
jgi:hypothetical protein